MDKPPAEPYPDQLPAGLRKLYKRTSAAPELDTEMRVLRTILASLLKQEPPHVRAIVDTTLAIARIAYVMDRIGDNASDIERALRSYADDILDRSALDGTT